MEMAIAIEAYSGPQESLSTAERFGVPPKLLWGYVGLLLFMIGDGVESGYLAPYLLKIGIVQSQIAMMFTIYGVTASIGAWFSGALSDLIGPRQVMWLGLVEWAIFEVFFLLFGVQKSNFPVMVVTYGIRGFGYPLFAYGFLVWIATATPAKRLGSAVGWFWFAFTGGLPTLGSFFASFAIPLIGQFATFWLSLGLVVLGGLVALFGITDKTGIKRLAPEGVKPLATLLLSVSIGWKKPKTAIGAIVRMINTSSEYGFLIFMPTFFTETVGFSLEQWLRLLSYIFLSNIFWNLIFGIVGDKVGWRKTVAFCGGVGCAVSVLLIYYVPNTFRGDYSLAVLVGAMYGATLAGYVPLSALMPSLAPENKGAAMSMLSLGAGASSVLGPAVVAIFIGPLGVGGVIWIYAILYLISAVLALFLTLPSEVERAVVSAPGRQTIGGHLLDAGSLLGHAPAMETLSAAESDIDLILFDLGGTIYDDVAYARALMRALHEINPQVSEAEFWSVYDAERLRSDVSLPQAMANHFVAGRDHDRLKALTSQYWEYPAATLYADVKPTLTALASKFKLGLVANAGKMARDALDRDGLTGLFTVLALADEVGIRKPDERIFRHALEEARVPAGRTVYAGNRLDIDIRPAQRLGLRTVWVLRGEAPPAPTRDQLDEPDAVVTSLLGLPVALSRLMRSKVVAMA